MKTQEQILELQDDFKNKLLRERNNDTKKIMKAFIILLDYVVKEEMTLEDLTKETKNIK